MSDEIVSAGQQWTQEIHLRFTYHPPKIGQPAIFEKLRDNARELAYLIKTYVPESMEKHTAMMKLEEVIMWANAGIVRRS